MQVPSRRLTAAFAVLLVACNGILGIHAAREEAAGDEGDAGADPASDAASADAASAVDAAAPCEDTLSDPRNCGRCGHDCRGGLCTQGGCVPERVVLPSSTTGPEPRMLAGLGHLLLLRLSGELTLARTNSQIGQRTLTIGRLADLAFDAPGQRLFARIDGGLFEAPLAPGSGPISPPAFAQVALQAPNRLEPYAAPASQALRPLVGYKFDLSESSYRIVALDGGLATIATGAAFDCDTHWSSGATLYYVGASGREIVARDAKTGAETPYSTSPYSPCQPRAFESSLVFETYVDPNYAILRRSVGSAALTTLATVPVGTGFPPLVVGASHAFWSVGATIYRAADGKPPEVFVEAGAPVRDLAWGDGRLFWRLPDNAVWTVAE